MSKNWYVIQIKSGQEEKIASELKKRIPSHLLNRCFVPKYKYMVHYQKEWTTKETVTFPGYVFIQSDDIYKLYSHLKKVSSSIKMLGLNKNEIFPLRNDDILFLLRYDENESFDISRGYIIGGKTVITSGPLMGREGIIRKIDRHKRLAFLEIDMLGQTVKVKVGLEIISKT